ncbi:protein FAM221A isoform X2 [Hoplias malabaricus]|uniref:protein FAM221A isoform X2 n=1 Tax=Hoplias malabaricus TaxID=27720 RepID=UPI00346280A9
MERMHIGKTAVDAVNAYVEYRRIVGEDDGGKLFSEAEYEEYKKKVIPARMNNRLYVSFGVPRKMDCKLIGPETPCFCSHRYKQHKTDFEELPTGRPIVLPCQVKGCLCGSYQYVQHIGSQAVRCRCKHLPSEHSEAADHMCKKCHACTGFLSPYTCGCGQPSYAHVTLIESREEREARGMPVGRAVPYAAMGGLTGFSSLADGYLRLDPSGSGLSPHGIPRPARAEQHDVNEGAFGTLKPEMQKEKKSQQEVLLKKTSGPLELQL